MKKAALIALAVLLVAAGVFAVYRLQDNEVVATVNGEKITKEQFYEALVENSGEMVLEQLVTLMVVSQEAQKQGINITEADVEARIEQMIQEDYYGSKDYFEQVLQQSGWTEDALKKNLLIDMMLTEMVRKKTEVTNEEVAEYFAENRADFDIPHEVNVRHILVDTEETAREVLEELEQGGNFAALAKEYSRDPGSAEKGGELGFVGKDELVTEFAEAAFAAPVGLIKEPVQSLYGYHIIEVLEIQEYREVKFAEVESDVREALINEKVQAKLYEEFSTLRQNADVETML
ncbi:MAG: foldase [Firmicutes bacterium]|nr:foldase [Bacillota bacterium]